MKIKLNKKYIFFASTILLLVVIIAPCKINPLLKNIVNVKLLKHNTEFRNVNYAIIIDYQKPIFKKRLWVIDLKTKETLIHSHVSHSIKSGIIWATKFSNEVGSNISSKGVFKTLNSYESKFGKGKYKIGMRLKGLEKGINDNVLQRNIVFHSSLGFWSSGCFMTLPWTNKAIVELTKNGNILIVNK